MLPLNREGELKHMINPQIDGKVKSDSIFLGMTVDYV